MNAEAVLALRLRLPELAGEIGRARLRVERDSSLAWTLDRIAGHVEALAWLLLEPTASEIVACTYPGDPECVDAALEHVDRRRAYWRGLLGYQRETA